MKKKISITINDSTLKDIDDLIDNIYIRNRSQAIELLVKNALGNNKVAVILFGGDENLLKTSKTDYRITTRIGNSTVIETALMKLKEEGFKKAFIIARQDVINKVFQTIQNGSHLGIEIEYIEEQESNGTAESLRLARGKIKGTFLVVYGDIVFNQINVEELWNTHLRKKGVATLLLTTSPHPETKGVVTIEGSKILDFFQKPEKSEVYLGFSSMFVCGPEMLEYPGHSLEEDVFPYLAKKSLLNGHLSSNREIHIHTKEDAKKVENII